jgi:hypothetical protein
MTEHFFIFRYGLSDIRINCNRISEGLLYLELWSSQAFSKVIAKFRGTLTRIKPCALWACKQLKCINIPRLTKAITWDVMHSLEHLFFKVISGLRLWLQRLRHWFRIKWQNRHRLLKFTCKEFLQQKEFKLIIYEYKNVLRFRASHWLNKKEIQRWHSFASLSLSLILRFLYHK